MTNIWLIFGTFFLLLGAAGWCLREIGLSRPENCKLIVFRSILMILFTGLIWWVCGFGFAFGLKDNKSANAFIGNSEFFLRTGTSDFADPTVAPNAKPKYSYAFFAFTWAAASLSALISTGGLMERGTFNSYLVWTFIYSGMILPIAAHWIWGPNGWASATSGMWGIAEGRYDNVVGSGAADIGGGIILHITGGICSFVGCKLVGPRKGRYRRGQTAVERQRYTGHAPHFAQLGTLLFSLSLIALNAVGVLNISFGRGIEAGRAVVNCLLAGGTAATTLLLWSRWKFCRAGWGPAEDRRKPAIPSLRTVQAGFLAGIVSVSAGAGLIPDYAAIIAGFVAALIYPPVDWFVHWARCDDPLETSVVHGVVGVWAGLVPGIFAEELSMCRVFGIDSGDYGVVYGGGAGLLGSQAMALIAVFFWSAGLAFGGWTLTKHAASLRIKDPMEMKGIDFSTRYLEIPPQDEGAPMLEGGGMEGQPPANELQALPPRPVEQNQPGADQYFGS
eukprot:NODE_835_length_1749_cov_17.715882_g687_i0.p1 GENE.NODE_835_length_1749_cov_17.715882_g687_i0~~NODE_835_length_1749_cov_17.715882_g687_i0.p1  ORF type:complete len:539 (+),score=91.37 NODE_835_length_1749_cov_17.715882_g687_i0:110-1618(+)